MPKYERLVDFMTLVREANPSYSSWVSSALTPLEKLLAKNTCTPTLVDAQISALAATADKEYVNKANKYKDALYFLQCTYPGIGPVKVLPVGGGAVAARMYLMTAKEPTLQANPLFVNRVDPAYTDLGGAPVEEFLLGHSGMSLGVLLIHLSTDEAPLKKQFCGWSAIHHMRSVIRVASYLNLKHCVLFIQGAPAIKPLQDVLDNADATPVQNQNHCGMMAPEVRAFASRYEALVVMGFDADTCVQATMFGSPVLLDGKPVPAVVNYASKVTSRPLLVTTGTINTPEYGAGIQNT